LLEQPAFVIKAAGIGEAMGRLEPHPQGASLAHAQGRRPPPGQADQAPEPQFPLTLPGALDTKLNIGFTFAAGSFTDPLDPRVQRFTEAYRQRWSTDADEYALLGYDVMLHEGLRLLGADGPAPLHMGFHMARTGPENGQRNEQGIMLRIRDLMLERAL
jgi:hypothetical protein